MQTYVELLKELKEKGFVPKTWDTTERMQGLWRTFTSFTSRGANVKIRITPQGIIVYNPLQTLGEIQEIEIEEERNGEFKKRKKQIRQYGGGPDLSEIRWAQLLGDTIVEVDLVPFMDWIVGALSRFEAIGLAKGKLRESLTARGPGSVVIRIEGREEPLLELPPMPYPRAVAAILQKIASVMVDAGPQTGMDLVKFLTSNE